MIITAQLRIRHVIDLQEKLFNISSQNLAYKLTNFQSGNHQTTKQIIIHENIKYSGTSWTKHLVYKPEKTYSNEVGPGGSGAETD